MAAYIVFLAFVMAVFGILGYRLGTKAMLLTTALIGLGLLAFARFGGMIVRTINGLYYGLHFVFSGGVQALGSSGDRADAINQVIGQMGSVDPLIGEGRAGVALLIVLALLVIAGLLLARLKRFRGPASSGGALLGILSGYIMGAYATITLIPEMAFLPVPLGLGQTATAPAAAMVPAPDMAWGHRAIAWLQGADDHTLSIAVMLLIAAFILAATRLGGKGNSKAR